MEVTLLDQKGMMQQCHAMMTEETEASVKKRKDFANILQGPFLL